MHAGRIQRNAQSSPLLRLPLKIRRKIFVEVLGDRLIHLKYTTQFEMDLEDVSRWDVFVCDPAAADPIKRLGPEQESGKGGNSAESSDEFDSSGFYECEGWRQIYVTDMGEDPGLRSAIGLLSDTEDSSDEEEHVGDEEEHGGDEEENGNHVMKDQGSSSDWSDVGEDIETRSLFSRKAKRTAEEVERMYDRKVQHLIGHERSLSWQILKNSIVATGRLAAPTWCRDDCDMHLRLLRTCRQIYTEANQVLWETNIFSLDDARTFVRFMDTRNTHQRGLINKIRLVMRLGPGSDWEWNDALDMPRVKSFQGLRFLWLAINERQTAKQFEEHERLGLLHRIMIDSKSGDAILRRLATLPLTKVNVVVTSKDFYYDYREPIHPSDLWTRQQQEKCAELIRARLLDVDRVKLFQQEKEEVKAF